MSPRRLKRLQHFALCLPVIPSRPLFFFLAFLLSYRGVMCRLFPPLLCPPFPSSSQTLILSQLCGASGKAGNQLITSSGLTCVRVERSDQSSAHAVFISSSEESLTHVILSVHDTLQDGINTNTKTHILRLIFRTCTVAPTRSIPARPSLIGHLSNARLHLAAVEHSLTFQAADLSSPTTTK